MIPIASHKELAAYQAIRTDRAAKFDASVGVYSFLNRLSDSAKKEVFAAIDAFKSTRSGLRAKSQSEQEAALQTLRVLISAKYRAIQDKSGLKGTRHLMDEFYSLIKNDSSFFKRGQTHSYQFMRRSVIPDQVPSGQIQTVDRQLIKNFHSSRPNVQLLFMLANNVDKIKLSTSSDQGAVLADHILKGKFGSDPAVLKALAQSVGRMAFVSADAQQKIASAISSDKFGNDSAIRLELARSLGRMRFTDTVAQKTIVDAIKENRFGTDKEVLEQLADSVEHADFSDGDARASMKESLAKTRAATGIQRAFTHYKSHVAVDLASRKIVVEHMKSVNALILNSATAYQVNGETDDYDPLSKLTDDEWDRFEELLDPYNAFVCGVDDLTSDDLKEFLRLSCKVQTLVCNGLAMTLAVKLRADTNLPQKVREDVRVCEVGGHVMCSIGDPQNDDSIIVDPWIRYLNLDSQKNWRPEMVRWDAQIRERGFMGSVAQYKKFLTDHPNMYVPSSTPKIIHTNDAFTERTKSISPQDLGLTA